MVYAAPKILPHSPIPLNQVKVGGGCPMAGQGRVTAPPLGAESSWCSGPVRRGNCGPTGSVGGKRGIYYERILVNFQNCLLIIDSYITDCIRLKT